MFYVQNVSKKPLGFGSTIILPNEVKPLPTGYGENHPTVQFYLTAKTPYLKRVGAEAVTPEPEAVTPEGAGEDNVDEGDKTDDLEAKIKALSKLNLDPLRNLATELGVEWVDTDTKAVLTAKITDVYQAAAE